MRIRTIAAMATGVALGAGGSYLLDPEHGPDRRREALRTAWERGREVDWVAVADRVVAGVSDVGRAAADGYRSGAVDGG